MTLPSRLVSILLVYCFVVAVAAPQTATVQSANGLKPPTNGDIFDRTYNFVSTLIASSVTPDDASEEDAGLKFRLSEAPGQPEAKTPANRIAKASVLSESETQAVLNRLPAMKVEASDQVEFALPDKSLPPPRTGAITMQPFPATGESAPAEQNLHLPLEVVRYSPEGDVPLAPTLSVTFSQPMMEIGRASCRERV